jgi:predicted secreted protein
LAKLIIPGMSWWWALPLLLSASVLVAAGATVTVTKDQTGDLALKPGDILRIELPTRGGTGYTWSLETPGAPVLKLLSQTSEVTGELRPGGTVMQVWLLSAEQPGPTEVRLAYYRPWEGVGTALEHFHLKVRVQ